MLKDRGILKHLETVYVQCFFIFYIYEFGVFVRYLYTYSQRLWKRSERLQNVSKGYMKNKILEEFSNVKVMHGTNYPTADKSKHPLLIYGMCSRPTKRIRKECHI